MLESIWLPNIFARSYGDNEVEKSGGQSRWRARIIGTANFAGVSCKIVFVIFFWRGAKSKFWGSCLQAPCLRVCQVEGCNLPVPSWDRRDRVDGCGDTSPTRSCCAWGQQSIYEIVTWQRNQLSTPDDTSSRKIYDIHARAGEMAVITKHTVTRNAVKWPVHTVAEKCDCCRCLAVFCDSRTFLRQCGQGLSVRNSARSEAYTSTLQYI